MPEHLYHASPTFNREAIQREGLIGPKGGFSYRVENGVGISIEDPDWVHPIHLSTTDLRDWIGGPGGFFYPDEPADLWVVDVTGLTLGEGWDGEGSYTVLGPISPDRLSLVTDPAEQPELPAVQRDVYPDYDFPGK